VTRQLELCDAVAGETAIVLATDIDDVELRGLFALALERLGCQVAEIIVRSGALLDGGDPVDTEAVALALTAADLVVDINGGLLERSTAHDEILEQARILAIDVGSVSEIDHLVAHPGLAKRLQRAEELLEHASSLTVSSPAGTLLKMSVKDVGSRSSPGTVVKPGQLAHWPAGAVWSQPKHSSIAGCIVAMPGDIIHEAGHLIRSPVRLEISKGKINDVLGETADADILRSHLEGVDDEHALDIAEIGWGMNLTRRGSELGPFDTARMAAGRGPLAAGRVNLRSGSRTDAEVGLTLSLGGASVMLDDLELVTNGRLEGVLAPDIYERAAGS
jgi:2,5-dihydroxypyridine 5,6-dioxygenase